ncbi:putative G-protein coupled receptor 150 isoform 1-T2 [Alca torda]
MRSTGARCPPVPGCPGHEDHREKMPVVPKGKDHRAVAGDAGDEERRGKMPAGAGGMRTTAGRGPPVPGREDRRGKMPAGAGLYRGLGPPGRDARRSRAAQGMRTTGTRRPPVPGAGGVRSVVRATHPRCRLTASPYKCLRGAPCRRRRGSWGSRAAAAPMEEDPFPPGLNLSAPGAPPPGPGPGPRAAWAGAVLLLALVGNGLVLGALRGGRLRRRRDLLLGHLALADLAGCGLALLPRLATELPGPAAAPGGFACRLLPLLQRCGPLASAHGLVLLALERHRPALPARGLAALGWLLAPLLALPQAFAFRPAPRPGGPRCRSVFEELPRWQGLAFAAYGVATGFLAPAGLLCWACARSGAARRRRRGGGRRAAGAGGARARRLPLVLSGLFGLCRLPRCALELGLASAGGAGGRREALAALGIVAAANSALNPFACLLLHGRLRRGLCGTATGAAAACCCPGTDGQGRRGATLRRPLRRRAPGHPGSAGTAGIQGSPGTPGCSGIPGSPSITGIPDTPGTPGILGSPGITGAPGSSRIPTILRSPGTPGTLGTPGTPVSPGTPAAAAAAPGPSPRVARC